MRTRHRLIALSLALLLHVPLGHWLSERRVPVSEPPSPQPQSQLVLLMALPPPPQVTAAPSPAQPAQAVRPPPPVPARQVTAAPIQTSDALTLHSPAAAAAEPPASVPDHERAGPALDLLHSEATRRAVAEAARYTSPATQAQQALGPPQAHARAQLGAAMESAVMEECLKGDPNASGGAGLLALPVLLYKAATGQCAR